MAKVKINCGTWRIINHFRQVKDNRVHSAPDQRSRPMQQSRSMNKGLTCCFFMTHNVHVIWQRTREKPFPADGGRRISVCDSALKHGAATNLNRHRLLGVDLHNRRLLPLQQQHQQQNITQWSTASIHCAQLCLFVLYLYLYVSRQRIACSVTMQTKTSPSTNKVGYAAALLAMRIQRALQREL